MADNGGKKFERTLVAAGFGGIFKYDFPFQRLQRLLFIFIPLKMEKDNGISSASINRPICTIGFGRCSLDIPYLRKR